MIPTRRVDRETHIAEILIKSEAALGELHQYYKFGRHEGAFPEKPYLLLSHCAHLLFSLWLTENESPTGLFGYSSHLNAMISSLDFDALRYADYKRRTLEADAYHEHLKNEPKWFKFWLTALEKQDTHRPLNSEEFSQNILTYVNHPGFLEGRISKKNRTMLADLMKTNTVDRIFSRSISVLEEVIAAIIFRFANLDQRNHTSEQMASLICLLRQVRRTIISESPAQGPYILLSNKNWGIPSARFRICGGRMRGNLKVVLKRDGGSIVCSYSSISGAQSKCRSWTRDASTLTHPYEEELFKTWSYDTGEPLHHPESHMDAKAYWLVQSTEAKRLRTVFRQIEMVVKTLAVNPQCHGLIAEITCLSMDNEADWQGTKLAWTYIKKLDQLLNTLNFACREASVLGGHNPGAEVIANIWPLPSSVREQANDVAPQAPDVTEPSQELPSPNTPSRVAPEESTEETPVETHCPQSQATDSQHTLARESTTMDARGDTDLTNAHDRTSSSCPQPLATSQETGQPDDEADETQASEGQPDALEQAQCSDTSLEQNECPDGPEQEQDQPIDAEFPVCESGQESPPQENQPADFSSQDPMAIAVSDRMFCEYIAQQPQRKPEMFESPSQAEPATEPTGAESCPSEQTPVHDYQTYFERLAQRGVAASVNSAANARYSRTLARTKRTKSKITPEQINASRQLLQKLLDHYGPHSGLPCETPLSLKTLQQTLGWKQSEVQRAMTTLFGRRPFTVYKHKCAQSVIGDFLEDCRHQYLDNADSQHDTNPQQTLQTV